MLMEILCNVGVFVLFLSAMLGFLNWENEFTMGYKMLYLLVYLYCFWLLTLDCNIYSILSYM